MSKEAVFTMKLEPELRAEFMAEAEAAHRPASQVVRELMREFVQRQREARGTTSSWTTKLRLPGYQCVPAVDGLMTMLKPSSPHDASSLSDLKNRSENVTG